MFHYLLPLIIAFPKGYDVCMLVPLDQIADRLIFDQEEEILISCNLINDGKVLNQTEKTIKLSKNKINKQTENFLIKEIKDIENPSYLELEITSKNKKLIFKDNLGLSFYSIFSSKDKKTFLSDNAYKTGTPNVIFQISKLKKFVDTYSAINIDKNKLLGETMFFINPYKKKVICKIFDEISNSVNLTIPPESCREQRLDHFAEIRNTHDWKGHIQIYATNRLITFNYKHNIKDNKMISDFEHLDPYRLEDTTFSFSELARIKIGNLLKTINTS